MPQRLFWVDAVRGFAIILMVIFHFCYDLRYFGYVDWHIPNGPAWWPFRYLILTLFIFTVGVSLFLAHSKHIDRRKFLKRLLQLMASAAAITVMSLFLFPKTWIYFGILHFIAMVSVIGLCFIRIPKVALLMGAVILVGFWLDVLDSRWPFDFFKQWLPPHTEDFVPLFPWLAVMLLGVGMAGSLPIKKWDLPEHEVTKVFSLIGKHGLLIYLLHQPILFAGFMLVDFL